MEALTQGKHARFSSLLPLASIRELGTSKPLSLWHAAALVGNAEAVRLLAAAGAPAAAADRLCDGPRVACALKNEPELPEPLVLLSQCSATALGIAAWQGHADVAAALLEVGAAPNALSKSLPSLTRSPCNWLTALNVAVLRLLSKDLEPPQEDATLQQLLAAGASTAELWRNQLEEHASYGPACRRRVRLVLHLLQRASPAGVFPLPSEEHSIWGLFNSEAAADAVEVVDHFAAQLLSSQQPAVDPEHAAQWILRTAARSNSLAILKLAGRAAQEPESRHVTAAARLLGPCWAAWLTDMMSSAAEHNRTEALQLLLADGGAADVLSRHSESLLCDAAQGGSATAMQLLLDAGAPPTAEALLAAVWSGSAACARALLAAGTPCFDDFPDDVTRAWRPHSMMRCYQCPILAALERRVSWVSVSGMASTSV